MPRISYITYQSEWDGRTRESLVEDLRREVRPEGAAEEAAFEAFTERSISYNDELGCWSCTAGKMTSWAIVDWDVPQNDLT